MDFSFEPVIDGESRILILGSFPSKLSRKNGFFYGNPNNRFWKMLAGVYGEAEPETIPEKKDLILRRHLALTDSAVACQIEGSADASMTEIRPRDLTPLFEKAPIEKILCNGRKSEEIIKKAGYDDAIYLPSTSPANASYSLEDLIRIWGKELLDG